MCAACCQYNSGPAHSLDPQHATAVAPELGIAHAVDSTTITAPAIETTDCEQAGAEASAGKARERQLTILDYLSIANLVALYIPSQAIELIDPSERNRLQLWLAQRAPQSAS